MAGLLIIGATAFVVSGNIVKFIDAIRERVEVLADYDFTFHDGTLAADLLNRKDEIGQITRAIKTMRDNIVDLIAEITRGGESVAAAAQELTAASQEAASASQEVAETIEGIARGSNEQARDRNPPRVKKETTYWRQEYRVAERALVK